MRVAKVDRSQRTDLQWDVLVVVGVEVNNLYEEQEPGVKNECPHLRFARSITIGACLGGS
jgi:hypothetical protein